MGSKDKGGRESRKPKANKKPKPPIKSTVVPTTVRPAATPDK